MQIIMMLRQLVEQLRCQGCSARTCLSKGASDFRGGRKFARRGLKIFLVSIKKDQVDVRERCEW